MLIRRVANQPIRTTTELKVALEEADLAKGVDLEVQVGGEIRSITLKAS
jgi:hypothetical protein